MNTDKVTRVEVINHTMDETTGLCKGRQYVAHNMQDVELSLQDDDRTLKIFLKNAPLELDNED